MMSKNARNKWAQMKKQKGKQQGGAARKNKETIAAGLGFKNKKNDVNKSSSRTSVLSRDNRPSRSRSELTKIIKSLNENQLEAIRYFAKLMFPMKEHYIEKRHKEMKAFVRDVRTCMLEIRNLKDRKREMNALEDLVAPFRVRNEDQDGEFLELLQTRLKDRCREVDTYFKGVSERKDRISRMDRRARKRKMKSVTISRKGVTAKDLSSDLGVSLSKLVRILDREGVRGVRARKSTFITRISLANHSFISHSNTNSLECYEILNSRSNTGTLTRSSYGISSLQSR